MAGKLKLKKVHKAYYTNEALEREGTWSALDPDGELPTRFRIRSQSAGTPKVLRRQQLQRYQEDYWSKGRSVPEHVLNEDNLAMGVAILAEWENVEQEDGSPLPFNEANVRELYESYPHLLSDHIGYSQNRANYGAAAEAEMEGNSGATSARG